MKIAIVGAPKSGTTIIYESVKNIVDKNAFYLFEPSTPEEMRFLRHWRKTDVVTKLMVGKLAMANFRAKDFDRILTITRDPRDILVSSLLYRFNRTGLLAKPEKLARALSLFEQKELSPQNISLTRLFGIFGKTALHKAIDSLSNQFEQITELTNTFAHSTGVRYEEFIEHGLDFRDIASDMKPGKVANLEGWTAKISRRGVAGDWKNWFTNEDLDAHSRIAPIVEKLGYNPEFRISDNPLIQPQYCSGYIRKLAKARDQTTSTGQSRDILLSAVADGRREALRDLAISELARSDLDSEEIAHAHSLMLRAALLGDTRAVRQILHNPRMSSISPAEAYLLVRVAITRMPSEAPFVLGRVAKKWLRF